MLQFYIPEVKGVEQVSYFFDNNNNIHFCFVQTEDDVDRTSKKEFEEFEEKLHDEENVSSKK